MKFFRHALFILSLLLPAGCGMVYEDLGDCPVENVTLLFTRMVDGSDEFRSEVQAVDVVVFNESGYFVMRKSVTREQIEAFREGRADQRCGTLLKLDPGTYRIVCWGNAGANTAFLNLAALKTIGDAFLQHTDYETGTGETYDPLYYAPAMGDTASPGIFTIAVSQHGTQTEIIDFTAAHDTVEIYIKGFGSSSAPATGLPTVEVTQMSRGYDFTMHSQNDRPFVFEQHTRHVASADGTLAGVQFLTTQLENDTPTLIHIKDPVTHDIVYTVKLREFIADNKIILNPADHDLIRIMVEFIGADVRLTIPNWGDTVIKPAF